VKKNLKAFMFGIEDANEVKSFLGEMPYTVRVIEGEEEVARAQTLEAMLEVIKSQFSSEEALDILLGEIVPTTALREFKIDGVKGIRLIVE
jgi:hypothetical protein